MQWGAPLRAMLTAALAANLLDAVTTWVAITRFQGREVGILGWWVVRTWGLGPAMVLLKGGAAVLIVTVALVGTDGQPRWWRATPKQRWLVLLALTAATLWFGYLATRNALGAWMVYRTMGQ